MPLQRPPEYFVFDLDGTLIDSLPDLATALNLVRSELEQPPLSRSEIATMVGDGATLLVQRALGAALYQPQHRQRFLQHYEKHLLEQTRCYTGIIELLQRHEPQRLAIVTNKPHALTMNILEGLELLQYFCAVIGGDSFPYKKPHPYPLQQALRRLGAQPQQTVMIGDHHTDLNAAGAAGTGSCFCAYGFGHAADLIPDYYAAQPADLAKLFPGLSLD